MCLQRHTDLLTSIGIVTKAKRIAMLFTWRMSNKSNAVRNRAARMPTTSEMSDWQHKSATAVTLTIRKHIYSNLYTYTERESAMNPRDDCTRQI